VLGQEDQGRRSHRHQDPCQERAGKNAREVTIPLYPHMTDAEQERVIVGLAASVNSLTKL